MRVPPSTCISRTRDSVRTALVIDDDESIRALVALALEMAGGWRVEEAVDGASGIDAAVATRPAVILLDVNLGAEDGRGVHAALRADPRTASIPVLFLTATVGPAEVAELRELADGVITKPFDPLTLPADVAAALRAPGE